MSDPRVATAVAQQPDVLGRGAPASAAGGWARLAGRAVGAPVAAVWFVDGTALSVCDRWVAPGAEPGRSVAPLLEAARPFAELVRERGEPYEVRDHHADAGCRPAAKAFLGVAVPAPDGHPAGVLGVLDTEARAWLPADYTTLHDLAALIAAAAHRRAEPPAGRPALLLPALLDSLESVAVVTCDADGRIDLSHDQLRAPPDLPSSVRADADRVLSWLRDMQGRPLRVAQTPLARAWAGEWVRDVPLLFQPADAAPRVLSVTGRPVRHPDGRPAGALVVVRDVTEARCRQRVRDGELAAARALTAGGPPAQVYDAVLGALGAAVEATSTELWLYDAVGGRARRAARWPAERRDGGGTDRGDAPDAGGTGERAALVLPIELGGHRFGSLRIGGARGPAVRELADSVAEQIAHYLEQARAAALAEELSRTRDEFIALAGHALRTPLTAISSFAELLREADSELADQRLALLGRIESNAATLRGIVEDLLDLAGLESGHVNLMWAPLDLAELVADRLAALAPADSRVHLDGDLPPRVPMTGDRTRLRQVVDHLLSNAVKYSPEGGHVRVALHRLDDVAELTVADEGLGVPLAERDKLFHRFFRGATAHERGIPGTGLGLALTRVIVERHGGSIALADTEGPGAAFTVRLPLHPPD